MAYLEAAAEGMIEMAAAEAENKEAATTRYELPDIPKWPFKPIPNYVSLMKTTWHQDAPYNSQCPLISGRRAKVGCVALALGQILAYNKKMYNVGPDKIVPMNGLVTADNTYYPQWPIITKAIETPEPAGSYLYQIQQYLSAIGRAVGMEYGVTESLASSEKNVPEFLKKIPGYTDVAYKKATIEEISTQLRFNEVPVYARGVNNGVQHAWVIDGWEKRTEWSGVGGGIIGDTPTEVDYVYCRFGFVNGQHDGWVKFDILSGPRVDEYQVINIVYYFLNKE